MVFSRFTGSCDGTRTAGSEDSFWFKCEAETSRLELSSFSLLSDMREVLIGIAEGVGML